MRRIKIVSTYLAVIAVLFVAPLNRSARADFAPGEFVTYSQDEWGTLNTPASQLLLDNFDTLYIGGVVTVGLPGAAMFFTSGESVLAFLPQGGPPAALDKDLQDPTSSPSGVFGGFVLALQLDVDFNDAGVLRGSSAVLFGDLLLHGLAGYPDFNGLTVREFLAHANVRLGQGSGPFTIDDVAALTQDLTLAFEGGTPSPFAQDHLRVSPAQAAIPEPGTLTLLLLPGILMLVRRPRRRTDAVASLGAAPDARLPGFGLSKALCSRAGQFDR